MDNTSRAIVLGNLRQYGDRAIAEALEGAFINAALANQIVDLKRKADMWDLHMEVKKLKAESRLAAINDKAIARKRRCHRFLAAFNIRKIK